jgi:hypothetical protein
VSSLIGRAAKEANNFNEWDDPIVISALPICETLNLFRNRDSLPSYLSRSRRLGGTVGSRTFSLQLRFLVPFFGQDQFLSF